MNNKKPASRKEMRDRRRRENFVGRSEQMRQFEENFLRDDPLMVFSVTGEGGVGKSTLLKQFASIASKHNAISVYCDDKHTSPASAMGHIAEELAKLKFTHHAFDERYKEYRKLRQEVEGDPKAPRGAIDLITRGVTDAVIKSVRRVPGASPFLENVDEKAAGETFSQFVHYMIDRWGNKDEVQLMREPERILTPLFLELVTKVTERQRLLLMFDVFERSSASLAPWLLALFVFEYGDFNTHLIFAIAGREPLEQHWTELVGDICHMPLEPFTPGETRAYLHNRVITDDQLVEQIHEDTGGLPVLVELLAATNPKPGVPLPDVSKDAVERFLQWVEQEDYRQAALLAAVPRRFNRDLLSAALGNDATITFNWLATQSFVRRSAEDGWFYHEKVRELMLRHLRNTTPKDLDATHARMADFFAQSQSELKLEGKDAYDSETWRKFECERIYHSVSAQSDRNSGVAVNAFLHASRWRWDFSEELVKCCQQSGREKGSQTIHDLADTLSGIYRAYDQDASQTQVDKLGSLERRNYLTTTSRCEIYALRGRLYQRKKNDVEALADFTRAIELDEKYDRAIAWRGEVYQHLGRYEEALADFTRAIELDEKYDRAIAWRGVVYRCLGRYEEALADYQIAIELDSEDSNTLLGLLACCRKLGLIEEYQRWTDSARELFVKKSEYNCACFAAIVGEIDDALALLRTALEKGETDVKRVRHDPDWYWICNDPRFTALLEEMTMRQ
jgi:tetratricopeptide (TPR) repeat protein